MESRNGGDRLIELEMRSMQQEKLLEELNEVIIEQRTVIERLERRVVIVTERLNALEAEHDDEG